MIGRTLLNVTLALIVIFWVIPFVGLLITSLRDTKHANETGFWRGLTTNEIGYSLKTQGQEGVVEQDGKYVISGNLFDIRNEYDRQLSIENQDAEPFEVEGKILSFGASASNPTQAQIGESITVREGTLTVEENGDYRWIFDEPYTKKR